MQEVSVSKAQKGAGEIVTRRNELEEREIKKGVVDQTEVGELVVQENLLENLERKKPSIVDPGAVSRRTALSGLPNTRKLTGVLSGRSSTRKRMEEISSRIFRQSCLSGKAPRIRELVTNSVSSLACIYEVFSWNVRGLNGYGQQRVVCSWLQSLGSSVGALLETHVQEENVLSVLRATAPGWRFDNNYSHAAGGRIWLLWSPAISVVVYLKTDQLILCGVMDPATGTNCTLAFIYAHNSEGERRSLWSDLATIANNSLVASSPLVIMGDFNQILLAEEHFSLKPYDLPIRGMIDFQECLEENSLSDMDFRGTFYSRSNKRPEDPILRKLDRALCNDKWREVFPDVVAVFEAPGDSDHSPVVVGLSALPAIRKSSFKYFSFISTHPKFLEELISSWQEDIPVGSKMFSFGQRLKKVKGLRRKFNKKQRTL